MLTLTLGTLLGAWRSCRKVQHLGLAVSVFVPAGLALKIALSLGTVPDSASSVPLLHGDISVVTCARHQHTNNEHSVFPLNSLTLRKV